MPDNLTQKLLSAHLIDGTLEPGSEVGLRINQTLTQDATGTLVMLQLEAMGLNRTAAEVSVQYVDHNLLQEDAKNPDDHLFLGSSARRFGIWFSRPGNGVSHPLHMSFFGVPGKTLLGADSHTCAAGALGMLAFGAGGLEVAMAMAGEPFYIKMPKVWGIKLVGSLPHWVSAKDIILEMLRRHSVKGGLGKIIEYYGPGLDCLDAMDRHVIANMGAELGASTSIFPSDQKTKEFMARYGRQDQWQPLAADSGAAYDLYDEIDLSVLEPLIAQPSSPDNVLAVSECEGEEIYQAYIGSSANPGFRDFAIAAAILRGRMVPCHVSLDINPASRPILEQLMDSGCMSDLIRAGARVHQAGCNGCIGMGQAPATGQVSLRTVPRNFPGRSGSSEDKVFLVSPETAAVSALTGKITDHRRYGLEYPKLPLPVNGVPTREQLFLGPLPQEKAKSVKVVRGPNIKKLPDFDTIPDSAILPVLLRVQDNISTDEILPAGARVLPLRSNIEAISNFCFHVVDERYPERAKAAKNGHAVIGGENYGQGSSREHAALAPRFLGLRLVLAKSYARIHRQNLINYGVLPLRFQNPEDYDVAVPGCTLNVTQIRSYLKGQKPLEVSLSGEETRPIPVSLEVTEREKAMLLHGGLINYTKARNLKVSALPSALQ